MGVKASLELLADVLGSSEKKNKNKKATTGKIVVHIYNDNI